MVIEGNYNETHSSHCVGGFFILERSNHHEEDNYKYIIFAHHSFSYSFSTSKL